jgi:hypothetical protein
VRRWIVPAGMAATLAVIAGGPARAQPERAPRTAEHSYRLCERRTNTDVSRTVVSGSTTWRSGHPSRLSVRGRAVVQAEHATRIRVDVAVFHAFRGTHLQNLAPIDGPRWVRAARVSVHRGANSIAFRAMQRATEPTWIGSHTVTGRTRRVPRSASGAAIRVVDASPAPADDVPLTATSTGKTPVTVTFTPPQPGLLLLGTVRRSGGATWRSLAPNRLPTADEIKADPDAAVAALMSLQGGPGDLWTPDAHSALRRLPVAGQRTTKLPAQPISC